MLVFVILAVFIAGLMVGRTPEYLGKKIEAFSIKWRCFSILVSSLTILIFAAIAVVTKVGLAGISNPGPHGLSQILYAYTSSAGNMAFHSFRISESITVNPRALPWARLGRPFGAHES